MRATRKKFYKFMVVLCAGTLAVSAQTAAVLASGKTDHGRSWKPELSALWSSGASAHSYLWMEAEDGILTAPMSVQATLDIPEPEGRNALSGACITTPAADGKESARASYAFSVPKDGTYKLWLRAWMPATDRDSFFYSIDGAEPQKYAVQLSNLTWKSPVTTELTAGVHRLEISCDKPNAVIDKLLLTTDPDYIPRGPGEPAQRTAEVQSGTAAPDLSGVSLAVKKAGTDRALLAWTPGSRGPEILKYKIYINNRLYGETPGNEHSLALEGLRPGTAYEVSLKAVNQAGLISRRTPRTRFTTQKSAQPPKAVESLSAEGGNVRVTLRWKAPGDKDTLKYVICRDGLQIALTDPEQGVFEDTGLAAGTRHQYTVIPVSTSGQLGAEASAEARVNPYINVRQAPYWAKGDGVTDDTEALQNAFHDWTAKTSFIYIPDGTYLLNHYLEFSDYVKSAKRMMVVGQSQAGTILKWQDSLPQYADPQNPRSMLDPYTGPEGPAGDPARDEINYQAFHNSLRNLTIDTGSGNPGAIAVRWTNNNTGGLENVTIRSGDGQGVIGLDLSKQWTGPGYMKNLTIEGFDVGINGDNDVYNMVFEDLTLKNQRVCGIRNRDYPMAIRRLHSENIVPVLINEDSPLETEFDGDTVISNRGTNSMVTIVDADFTGGTAEAAIENPRGAVFLRNVRAEGYGRLLNDQGRPFDGLYTEEYSTLYTVTAFEDSERASLNLPMEDTPALPFSLIEAAASPDAAYVTDYGAVPGDKADDSDGIQRAIDSGKKYVVLPNGTYHIGKTLHIRGNVNAVIGFESVLHIDGTAAQNQFDGEDEGVFQIGDVSAPFVLFENLSTAGGYPGCPYIFVHAAKTPLAIRHMASHMTADTAKAYRNTVTGGKVFADDTSLPIWLLDNQTMYARQFNPECRNTAAKVVNTGGNTVILGYKSEGNAAEVISRRGARTEIVGGSVYPASGRPALDHPAFITEDSQISVNLAEAVGGQDAVRSWDIWFRDTQNGETREVTERMLPRRGIVGTAIGLYTDYQKECTLAKLCVDGVEYPYFAFSKLEQVIPVPSDIGKPPELSAAAFGPDASVTIQQAASLSEPAYITVEENGKTRRYTLTFAADGDTALASLRIDLDGKGTRLDTPAGLLNFDPEQTEYVFYVTPDEHGGYALPQISAKARARGASVSIRQADSVPGTAVVTVTAENGTDTREYTVNLVAASPSSAQLKSLRVWNNYLQNFDPNQYAYEFALYDGQLSSVRPGIAAEAQNGRAEVKVTNPDSVNGIGTITVISADKANTQTYTVRFTSTDNNVRLSGITLGGQPLSGFDPAVTEYHAAVSADAEITATAQSPSAEVTVERGSGRIDIRVTSSHGLFHKLYTIYTD